MSAVWKLRSAHEETPSRCWYLSRVSQRWLAVVHLSVGLPVWWLPQLRARRYRGVTEVGAGWLLLAAQFACKRKAAES